MFPRFKRKRTCYNIGTLELAMVSCFVKHANVAHVKGANINCVVTLQNMTAIVSRRRRRRGSNKSLMQSRYYYSYS